MNTVRYCISILWAFLIFGVVWISKTEYFPKYEVKTLDIFGWPEMFLPDVLNTFEKKTGIKVRLHYYTSNEELLVKLKATKGKGYDLIIPSDYAVKTLIEEQMLQPLDKSQLNFLPYLNPLLLGLDYDLENIYAIPYQWEVFGFGIDTEYFNDPLFKPSWQDIFNPTIPNYKIAMINDPIEAVNFAAFYLYGPKKRMEEEQIYEVYRLLDKQKSWVEAYAGLRADYLLATKNCQIALCSSSYIFRTADHYSHVKFVIPEDWSFMSIENFCIPKNSEKESLAYAFLNHIYAPQNLAADCKVFYNFPATTNVYPYLEVNEDFKRFLQNSKEYQGKLHFIRHIIPEKRAREIWVKVKS